MFILDSSMLDVHTSGKYNYVYRKDARCLIVALSSYRQAVVISDLTPLNG
jgi:hypothetical protein